MKKITSNQREWISPKLKLPLEGESVLVEMVIGHESLYAMSWMSRPDDSKEYSKCKKKVTTT